MHIRSSTMIANTIKLTATTDITLLQITPSERLTVRRDLQQIREITTCSHQRGAGAVGTEPPTQGAK